MRAAVRATVVGTVAILALAACTAGTSSSRGTSSAGSSSTATAAGTASSSSAASTSASPSPSASVATPATLSLSVPDAATDVRADTPVTVTAAGGTLGTVTLTTKDGSKSLQGAADAAGATWTNTDLLTPGQAYTLTASATGTDGATVTKTSSFATKAAAGTTSLTIIPGDDWTVGVGMPVIVTFARKVTNKAAVEKTLSVTSTPAVEGAWNWMSDSEVQWRPKEYWPSGTKVFVKTQTQGAELAPGVWGRRTVTSEFTIGRKQISTVDVKAHTLTVERDGQVLRTIPVTTGKSGFLTRGGTKVIMEKLSSVRMDSETTGIKQGDPNYYNLLVNWALRLTWSGEFLHAAPWSVWAQGKQNVSHGCTGMSTTNARWMFDNSEIGDVVVYTNSNRPLEWGNGYTVWNKPFDEWATPQV